MRHPGKAPMFAMQTSYPSREMQIQCHIKKGVQLHEFPDLLKYHALEAIGTLYSYQNLSTIFLILSAEMLQLLKLPHLCQCNR